MNIIPLKGYDVMIDYAHNPRAYVHICDLIGKLDYKRRILVLDAVGDRRDEDITQLAQIASKVADRVILYEDKDLRGRQEGEIAALLDRGFEAAAFPRDRRTTVLDEFEAIGAALKDARPGDLIVYMTGRVQKAIQFVYDTKEQLEPLSTPPVEESS